MTSLSFPKTIIIRSTHYYVARYFNHILLLYQRVSCIMFIFYFFFQTSLTFIRRNKRKSYYFAPLNEFFVFSLLIEFIDSGNEDLRAQYYIILNFLGKINIRFMFVIYFYR